MNGRGWRMRRLVRVLLDPREEPATRLGAGRELADTVAGERARVLAELMARRRRR